MTNNIKIGENNVLYQKYGGHYIPLKNFTLKNRVGGHGMHFTKGGLLSYNLYYVK